ncbi:MAG: hypothetical protein ACD_79C00661G0001, partial [uncultured bacterium]
MAGTPHLQMEHTTTINDVVDLQLMAVDLTETYILANNIDASGTVNWNGGLGFDPVDAFTGSFNGANYNIDHLFINRPTEDNIGLFSYINDTPQVYNTHIINADITGQNSVGILIGDIKTGLGKDPSLFFFDNCSASGIVNGVDYVGGLIGNISTKYSSFYFSNMSSSADVEGNDYVGGLVGYTKGGAPTDVFATGSVTGNNFVGGLYGVYGTRSQLQDSYATGDVVAIGGYVGGLIGSHVSQFGVVRSYATGDVAGGGERVGGLIGHNFTLVMDSYSTGNVSGLNNVGGLLGYNLTFVTNCFATGNTQGNDNIGGLTGYNSGTISESYAAGAVDGVSIIGGLVGLNDSGVIQDSYSVGTIHGNNMVGGVVGKNSNAFQVSNSYTQSLVFGNNESGGFVGNDDGTGIYSDNYWYSQDVGLLRDQDSGNFFNLNGIDDLGYKNPPQAEVPQEGSAALQPLSSEIISEGIYEPVINILLDETLTGFNVNIIQEEIINENTSSATVNNAIILIEKLIEFTWDSDALLSGEDQVFYGNVLEKVFKFEENLG